MKLNALHIVYLLILGLLFLLAAGAPLFAPYDPVAIPEHIQPYLHPVQVDWLHDSFVPLDRDGRQTGLHCSMYGQSIPACDGTFHLLGTDKLGRDYLSRLLYGLRPTLLVAVMSVLISFPLGVLFGTMAGYVRDSVGQLMMRCTELILSFPTLYILVVLAGIMPTGISNSARLCFITVILAFIGWASLARIVYGQVLSIRSSEFVQYARTIGVPGYRIIFRELIPQLSTYLVISLATSFPVYMLGEASLSFLGMGISQPDPSLGNLLAEGKELSNLFLRPWLAGAPIAVLLLVGWSCNALGDLLRDRLDTASTGSDNAA